MAIPDLAALRQRFLQHQTELASTPLSALFEQDHQRAERYSIEAAGLLLDYSKHYCTAQTLQLFDQLAASIALRGQIDALFAGASVNNTEQRAALHTALRARSADTPHHAEVQAVLARMQTLTTALHERKLLGFSGKPFTDVVNIGIGGSDLGPRCVTHALRPLWRPELRVHFVANVDPAELHDVLAGLDPATTLLITASKSFATQETLANSEFARRWLLAAAQGRPIADHLIAITAKPAKAIEFGVREEHIFPMWDWVGGRYSLWSAIGLPIALAVGWHHFRALLDGADAMDAHYRTAPFDANMPVLLAMLECWYSGYWHAHSALVLPYSHRLRLFPAFLQQLSMESLGKSVDRNGRPLTGNSGAVIWGEPGTNSQHSFMQLLHQGTRFIPVDFVAVLEPEVAERDRHEQLFANCLSQSRVLMCGKTEAQALRELLAAGMPEHEARLLAPHKAHPGNRPSSTIALQSLTPERLGALIALYEHKVHAQSAIWNINAFDQWGVEFGKQSAGTILDGLRGDSAATAELDPSTLRLIGLFAESNPNGRH